MPSKNFFIDLTKQVRVNGHFHEVGSLGPYSSLESASTALDKLVASREGEQLLELLEVSRLKVRSFE